MITRSSVGLDYSKEFESTAFLETFLSSTILRFSKDFVGLDEFKPFKNIASLETSESVVSRFPIHVKKSLYIPL